MIAALPAGRVATRSTMAKDETAHNLVPEVLWAQRAGEVYLTINLSDVQGEAIDLNEDKLHFKGESNGKTYEVTLEFAKQVDPSVSCRPGKAPSR